MSVPSIILPQLPKIDKLRSSENSKLVNVGVFLIPDNMIPNLNIMESISEIIFTYNLKKILISFSSGKNDETKSWFELCNNKIFGDVKIYFIPDGLPLLISYCPENKKDCDEVKQVLDGVLPSDLTKFISNKIINKDVQDIFTDVDKFYFIKGLNRHSCDYKLRSQHIYNLLLDKHFVSMRGIDMNIFYEIYLNPFGYINSIFEDLYAIYFNIDFSIS
jgi:hypothetical protein